MCIIMMLFALRLHKWNNSLQVRSETKLSPSFEMSPAPQTNLLLRFAPATISACAIVRIRHASDIASALTELGIEDQVIVFRILPRKDAAAVFEYLSLEQQGILLKAMAQEDVAALLNGMAPDDRTPFLENCLPPPRGNCWRCYRRLSGP